MLAIPVWRESALFDAEERDVLELADHLAGTEVQVPEALYARLVARYTSAQLVELASAIAWEHYRARFNRVFDVGSDGLGDSAVCLVLPRRSATKGAPDAPAPAPADGALGADPPAERP